MSHAEVRIQRYDEFLIMPLWRWSPSQKVNHQEAYLLKRCEKKRRLFAFLRAHRQESFDEGVQRALEGMYRQSGAGEEPICPGLMAMALLPQGYLGVSDAGAVELSIADLRWYERTQAG